MQSDGLGKEVTLHGIVVVVQFIALLLMVGPSLVDPGFPLDDAWIHQVIARTFAQTGTLGYEAGRYGSAATSLLWPVILAINPALLDMSPVLFTGLVGVVCYVAAGHVVLRLLLADGFAAGEALLYAVLFSVAGNAVWFAVSGMESSLIVVLSVVAVNASFKRSLGPSLACGGALALLFLTRPECALLGLLVVVARVKRGERDLRQLLALTLPVLASVSLFGVLNLVFTGALGPATLEGRKWMWFATAEGWNRFDLVDRYGLMWVERLGAYSLGFAQPLMLWPALGLALVGASELVRLRAQRTSLLALCALVHLAVYAVLMPTLGHGGRYQPLTPSVFLMLAGVGVISVARGILQLLSSRGRNAVLSTQLQPWVPMLGAPLVVHALMLVEYWGLAHALAVTHVNQTEVAMGQSVKNLPADARVATFDIGGIGYFADRQLFDLGGLVDPTFVSRLKDGTVTEFLHENRVDYLVLPMSYTDTFPDPWNFADRLGLLHQDKVRLVPVLEHYSPPEVWTPGLDATWHCSPRQKLFRLEVTHVQ
jgi:hypothetical protein